MQPWAWAARTFTAVHRSTQPCIPLGSLNRVPALAGVKAGMLPLPGGRQHCVIPYGMSSRSGDVTLRTVRSLTFAFILL